MKCEETYDLFVSVGGKPVRCVSEAQWAVSVNPPSANSDGKVRLCDFHNGVDYRGFARERLSETQEAKP